jgi:hypothetical protein
MDGSGSIFREEHRGRARARAAVPSVVGWSLAALSLLAVVVGVVLLIDL